MLERMARHWWILLLRGILAVLFALIAFFRPGITLAVLVLFFGAYVFVDGIFGVIAAIRFAHEHERWWVLLLEGIFGIILGILTLFNPSATALALLYVIAAWAIITGVLEIATAVRLRRVIQGEWLLGLTGVLSVLLGIILVVHPVAGLFAWVWVIGAYALLFGILLIALSFRLRSLSQTPARQP